MNDRVALPPPDGCLGAVAPSTRRTGPGVAASRSSEAAAGGRSSVRSWLAASGLVLLAACGGGGGDGGSGAPASVPAAPAAPTGPTTGPTAIALHPAVAGVALPAPTADRATNAFNFSNYRRAQLGLDPLVRDAALDRAAAAHLGYVLANRSYLSEGHSETAGRSGYTGATPAARTAAAGYVGTRIGENMAVASTTQGFDAADGLVEAPYHRQGQLGNYASAGAAMAAPGSGGYYVVDFGGTASAIGPSATEVVVYPANGETAAPIDWLVNEIPSPLPDLNGQRVGFPISLGATGALSIGSFGLKDDRGVAVTTRLVTTRTDTGGSMGNYAFIVPLAPLASGTRYTATATGSVASNAFDLSWSFTTAPAQTLTVIASGGFLAAAPGSAVEVTVSGGTGRYLAATLGFDYVATANPGPLDLVSLEKVSETVWRIVRGTSACAGPISSCTARIVGSDSAGTRTTPLSLPIR